MFRHGWRLKFYWNKMFRLKIPETFPEINTLSAATFMQCTTPVKIVYVINRLNLKYNPTLGLILLPVKSERWNYFFFLCLFFRSLFLRLCVAILCLFLFFPLGIINYFTWFLTFDTNDLAGLNDGILWAGIMIVVFLEILRAVFSALFFTTKLPKPLR